MRRLLAALLLTSCALPAVAAESYDACAGYIDTLPATITTQGNWCLRKDLATAVTSGAAITVATNNVTIDCNGFKLGGLAAGPASVAAGVLADNRRNLTIRGCALRGFHTAVRLTGADGGGHLVEDNRVDQSLFAGISVQGQFNTVQRNRIYDTGTEAGDATGIVAQADILDNIIDGAIGHAIVGISVAGAGYEVRGNKLRDLWPAQAGSANGITTTGLQHVIAGNQVTNFSIDHGITPGVGILSAGAGNVFCRDNLVGGYATGMSMCEDNGGNAVQ